jgi:thioredoxin-related protein
MIHLTYRRRQFSAAIAAALALPALCVSSRAFAKDSALPVPVSLRDAALAAASRGEPLVLLVSLPGCPYCEVVRRNYLLPGRRSANLQAWQLDITDAITPLASFSGEATTAKAQVKSWKASFAPTVLFLGPQGQELAERLVGAGIPDFYGAYLEERLAGSRRALAALR